LLVAWLLRSIAADHDIGHQIAMKSDKKETSATTAKSDKSGRREREAAALRANLLRRKQQQKARQTGVQAEDRPEDKDRS